MRALRGANAEADGVTAIGRAIRAPGERAEAALSISMPSVRFSREKLPQLVAALAFTARDIEQDLADQLSPNS
jgi:DNA-binding IclR family transcriptional regulator